MKKKTFNPNFRTLSEIYLISLFCKVYEQEYDQTLEEINFFNENVKNNKISKNKNEDIYFIYGVFYNFITDYYFPNLKKVDIKLTESEFLKEIKILDNKKDIALYNTVLIITHCNLLRKKIIIKHLNI